MKKMTKIDALNIALTTVENEEAREIITSMINQLSKPRKMSDEAKAAANAKRKEKTSAAREELMSQVLPILRGTLSVDGMTAKELFEACADSLPEGFTSAKVQYILLHEMVDEVVKVEKKGKANTYCLKA